MLLAPIDWLEQSDGSLICGGYADTQRELGIIAMIQMVRGLLPLKCRELTSRLCTGNVASFLLSLQYVHQSNSPHPPLQFTNNMVLHLFSIQLHISSSTPPPYGAYSDDHQVKDASGTSFHPPSSSS
jgi:hypothetical protein